MMRAVYRGLLWLHPPEFRRQFAAEMLWIFEEAAAAEGALRLATDGFVSLARQWVWRCGVWKILAGAAVAVLQLVLLSGLANVAATRESAARLPESLHGGDIAFSQALVPVLMMLTGFLGALRARAGELAPFRAGPCVTMRAPAGGGP